MAIYSLEKLVQGDENLITYYRNAMSLWMQITLSESFSDVEKLAQELTDKQLQFEYDCGGRWIGQEIMVITGICQFYNSDIGFGDSLEKAVKVKKAFEQSYCSVEVKFHTEEISRLFYLEEYE